jgi:hypothetical protein
MVNWLVSSQPLHAEPYRIEWIEAFGDAEFGAATKRTHNSSVVRRPPPAASAGKSTKTKKLMIAPFSRSVHAS